MLHECLSLKVACSIDLLSKRRLSPQHALELGAPGPSALYSVDHRMQPSKQQHQ
jgi:hypothetical protein